MYAPPPLLLIHGDYLVSSRQFLRDTLTAYQRLGFVEVIRFTEKNLDLTTLIQACESQSLIATKRVVVIENVFKLPKPNQKIILPFLIELLDHSRKPFSTILIIWEAQTLTPAQLKPFSRASVKVFRTPTVIFNFLESIYPGNEAQYIPLYQHLIKNETAESIFAMIVRQIRLLIQIEDPDFKLPPWQLKKLAFQRQHFGLEALLSFQDTLTELDRRHKTGALVGSFDSEFSLILLKL